MRKTTILHGMMITLSAGLFVGCGEKPVYDEMAVRKTQSVLVVPFVTSAKDPAGGTIAAGMISRKLMEEDLKDLRVRVTPVTWRMIQPTPRILSDAEAVQMARTLGVDGVVTGTVNLTMETEKPDYKPEALKAGQVPSSSDPSADLVVTFRLLSTESGACIYSMNGRATGISSGGRMEVAIGQAVDPLIGIWRKAQRGW